MTQRSLTPQPSLLFGEMLLNEVNAVYLLLHQPKTTFWANRGEVSFSATALDFLHSLSFTDASLLCKHFHSKVADRHMAHKALKTLSPAAVFVCGGL